MKATNIVLALSVLAASAGAGASSFDHATSTPSSGAVSLQLIGTNTDLAKGEDLVLSGVLLNSGLEPLELISLDWTATALNTDLTPPSYAGSMNAESYLIGPVTLFPGVPFPLFTDVHVWGPVAFDTETTTIEHPAGNYRLELSMMLGLLGEPVKLNFTSGLVAEELPVDLGAVDGIVSRVPSSIRPDVPSAAQILAQVQLTPGFAVDAINTALSGAYNWRGGQAWDFGTTLTGRYNSANEQFPPFVGNNNWSNLARWGFNDWAPTVPAINWGYTNVATVNGNDGVNAIFWIADTTTGAAIATAHSFSFGSNPLRRVAFDVTVNNAYTFQTSPGGSGIDYAQVLAHEAGHVYGLGHLYNPGETNGNGEIWEDWMGGNNRQQIMYWRYTPTNGGRPNWGDMAGINFVYADDGYHDLLRNRNFLQAAAYADLNGLGPKNDLVSAYFSDIVGSYFLEYFSHTPDESCLPVVCSSPSYSVTLAEESIPPAGLSIAVSNFNSDPRPEVVVHWLTDNFGENIAHFRVLWDLDKFGKPTTIGPYTSNGGGLGHTNQGYAVCYTQLDADSRPDVVQAWIDAPVGANTIYYRRALNVNTAGFPGAWGAVQTLATVGWDTPGLGIICTEVDHLDNRPDVVFAWIDNPSGVNSLNYRLIQNMNSDGTGTLVSKSVGRGAQVIAGDAYSLSATLRDASPGDVDWSFNWMTHEWGDALHYVEHEGRIDSHN